MLGLIDPMLQRCVMFSAASCRSGLPYASVESSHLDWIAKRRSGPVRFDVGDRPRVDACFAQAAADRFCLRLRIRRGESNGAAAGAQTRAFDHAVNAVTAAQRLIERSKDHDASAFAEHRPVRLRAKRLAFAARREDAQSPKCSETDRDQGSD